MSYVHILWLFALCFGAALTALLATRLLERRLSRPGPGLFDDPQAGTVLLFDGETLLDATAGARAMLAVSRMPGSAWQRFLAWAAPRFPGVEQALERLPDLGRISVAAPGGDGLTLVAEWRSGIRRITVLEPHVDSRNPMIDALTRQAQEEELDALRELTDEAPLPIWREDAEGAVIWANRAYVDLTLAQPGATEAAGWPLPRLIDLSEAGRTTLGPPEGGVDRWFDCHIVPLAEGRIVFGLPADAAVQAERALGNFVQTLTKTFAYLPIGLAIFDRDRRLQLFNPALGDLTGLAPEFLSARPGLFGFLDAMREGGMIPEPKDYKAWRAQLAEMEQSAADGRYEETWALPNGLTYRVTGRPHPEGALALLFQDISDEITRARRMRADLELGQSVIDATDEAIAVLSSAGHLVMSNTAYARLWGHDPSGTLADQTLASLSGIWRGASAPDPFWEDLPGYIGTGGPRARRIARIRLNDGRALVCRLAPLSGGATLIGFAAAGQPVDPGLSLHDPGEEIPVPPGAHGPDPPDTARRAGGI